MKPTPFDPAYARDGVARVAGAFDAAAMRARLTTRIAAATFVPNAGALRPAVGTELALWEVGREPVFAGLPDAVATAMVRALGPGWRPVPGEQGGYAIPNLPLPGAPWGLCPEAWHVDETIPAGAPAGAVALAYAMLDEVAPGGGATTVIAGSHRWLEARARETGADVDTDSALAALAAASPWFADLLAPGPVGHDHPSVREGCVVDGLPLRVVELTGAAGDVVFMDPRCLHTTAANVSSRARLAMRLTAIADP